MPRSQTGLAKREEAGGQTTSLSTSGSCALRDLEDGLDVKVKNAKFKANSAGGIMAWDNGMAFQWRCEWPMMR